MRWTKRWAETVTPNSHRFGYATVVVCGTIAVGLTALGIVWRLEWRFVGAVMLVGVVQLTAFWWILRDSDRTNGPQPLTAATVVTLGRAGLLALFAGFVVIGRPDGPLEWLPALLFVLVGGLDAVDGALARARDAVTEFGGRLDTNVDSLAVLIGAAVAVGYATVPVYYLLVGGARYLFVGGIWWRTRRGRSVSDLPPSRLRRPIGSLQLVVIALALLPIVDPALSRPVAAAALVALAGSFTRDWLAITDR